MVKKSKIVLFGFLCVLVLLSGCRLGAKPGKYELTVSVSPENAGTVTPVSGSEFEKNTLISLTPAPNAGWRFDHWGGPNANEVVQQDNTWKILMTGNKSLTAVFVPSEQVFSVKLEAAPLTGEVPLNVEFTATISNAPAGTLTYDWEFGDTTVQSNGGPQQSHTYTAAGSYLAKVTVKAANNETRSSQVTILAAVAGNHNPTAATDTVTMNEDEELDIDVLSNDTDPDHDTLAIVSVTTPAHGTAAIENSKVRYVPAANYHGTDSFQYAIFDGKGGTANGTVHVTITPVNDAPVAQNDAAESTEAGTLVHVLSNDTDVDGDTLAIESYTQGAHGTVTQENNSLRYVPHENFSGEDQFTYKVTDGKGGTATAVVAITVSASANHAPAAATDTAQVDEDSSVLIEVLANDSDPDGDPLSVSEFSQGVNGTVTREENKLRYAPKANYNGSDSFTYLVSDGKGGTATGTVNITVKAVNDAPTAVADAVKLNEDTWISIDVLANDTDIDGDTLSVDAFTQGAHGTVVKDGKKLKYTPSGNYCGSDTFTYTVKDSGGLTSTATVSITVEPVNDIPVTVKDIVSLDEDTTVLINVLGNDSDVDGDTLAIAGFTQPAHGAVVREGNGLRYIPAANYFGSDSFTYVASDGKGGTATGSVMITVRPVNDAPNAQNDAAQLHQGETILVDVLANDSDVDQDPLTISGFTQGTHGAVTQEGNRLRYTVSDSYTGKDTFTYTVSDGKGKTATATVTMTILSLENAPVANDDTVEVDEDSTVLMNLVANDTDSEGDHLTITDFTQPRHGLVVREGEKLRYTPVANYNGSDSFTYTVSDGKYTDTAAVAITVKAVNDLPEATNDSAEVTEDGTILISVLTNDRDIDGDALTISAVTQGAHGTAAIEGNKVRYTPAANYFGPDSFTYTIDDGKGGTVTASVSVTVTAVNDAPNAANDTGELDEDSTVLIDVLANDTDVEGDTLTIASFTQGLHGAVIKEGDSLRYTPAANYHGTDSFTYTVSDGKGGVKTATVNITVLAVNDQPVAVNDTAQADEDQSILIDVLANDSDVDGDTLTISAVTQGAHGTAAIEGGKVRYTPAANYKGSDSFTYTISDGKGGTATAAVNVTVLTINDAPNAVNDTVELNEDSNILIDVLANDSDPEGDTLTITEFTQGAHGSVTKEGNSLRYTPAANYNGPDSFTYTVSDGQGGTATATVNVTVVSVNDLPVSVNDTAQLDEDGTVLIDVLANDSDADGDILAITQVTQGAHGTVVIAGAKVQYTPAANYFGPDSFTYTVSDGKGGTATATVAITVNAVNDAPVVINDFSELNEDSTVLIDVLGNDSDVEGETLSVTGFTQGAHGSVVKEGNSLRYTPAANYNGSDIFTYTASDGKGGTTTGMVTVTVQPVNDLPVSVNDTALLDEDGTVLIDVLANDSDVDGDILAITLVTQGVHGTVVIAGTEVRYTPAANYFGPDGFIYTVSDGKGGTATATVAITVNAVNDAPVLINDTVELDEDSNILIDVLANDSDIEGDTLAITGFTQGAHGSVIKEGNSLRYTPVANYNGPDSFTYTVSDGKGGVTTAAVNITVVSVNDLPVSVNDTAQLDEDGTVLIDVLANDSDVDGDILAITLVTQGVHGTVVIAGTEVRYTPAANYFGPDGFIYTVSDGKGGTATATVAITVNAVNDAPVLINDTVELNEDSHILIDVLANDSDIEGDTLAITGFTQGAHGSVIKEGNSLRYTPAANYNGSDSFTYTVSDGQGGVTTAAVNITVVSVNDLPVAMNDTAQLAEDGTVLIDVLANDSDLDGDTLAITQVTQGAHGAVVIAGTEIRYTPAANYFGSDSFTYTVSDGKGGTATATVAITVNAVNDAPVANDDNVELDEDSTILVNVLANDSDVEGDLITIADFSQGAQGTVTQEGNSLRYTPAANYHGTDSFTYRIGDGHGGSMTATVYVTVNSVNDLPVAVNDTVTLDEDGTTLVDVLGNDTDTDGDVLAITVFTQGAHGTVAKEGNSLRYTPAANYYGTDSFTYDVSDGHGGTATATVNVTVRSVNDAPTVNDDSISVNEDDSVLINVLLNDTDIEGHLISIATFTQGSHGSVVLEGDRLRYTPDHDYYGADSFTYVVGDGNGDSSEGTVHVTVIPVNDQPVAKNDTAELNEDSTILIDVIVNDSDVEGDLLTITGFTQGTKGTVTKEGNSLRYTPNPNLNGNDSFTYTISDGNGGSSTATVQIAIHAVNDAPSAVDDSKSVDQDGDTLVDVLANDTDIDGDSLSIVSFTNAAHGTVSIVGNSIRYKPAEGYSGSDSFTYTISDGKGGLSTATVNMDVLSASILSVDISGEGPIVDKIITITKEGNYSIKTSFLAVECDTVLGLFNESGTMIDQNDDDGVDYYSHIVIWLAPGTYRVRVEEISAGLVFCHLEVEKLKE